MKRIIGRKRASDIIDRFSESHVLVVGDVMVDHFIWGKVSRISPEAPVPVVEVSRESMLLGGAANVLNNVAAAGGSVSLAGVIGPDERGRWIIQQMRRKNVDTSGIVVEQDRPTIVKTRIVAHNQQVVRFDRENKGTVGTDTARRLVDYIKNVIHGVGAVIVSDYRKGVISEDFFRELSTIVADAGVILCVDPKQNSFSRYHGCDIITPNHHEAETAAGITIETEDDIIAAGRTLLERNDFRSVLITQGEEGMVLFERNADITYIPAVAKEVFDVTGAGDTVIGILALALASGATLKEAAVLANCAAGIVVGKVGTATVSRNELRAAL